MTTEQGIGSQAASVAAELRGILRRLNRRLRQQADFGDLTRSQLNVLSRLEHEGPGTVSELARAEGVRPQSMGATVVSLEVSGLVRRDPDPTDGRKTVISLTGAARDTIATSRSIRQDWLQRVLSRELDSAELDRVSEAIALLSRIADAD